MTMIYSTWTDRLDEPRMSKWLIQAFARRREAKGEAGRIWEVVT